jgi:hypothetical protein
MWLVAFATELGPKTCRLSVRVWESGIFEIPPPAALAGARVVTTAQVLKSYGFSSNAHHHGSFPQQLGVV